MKKAIGIVVALLMIAGVFAATSSSPVVVNGVAYSGSSLSSRVANAPVSVVCTHNAIATVKSTLTRSDGSYMVSFDSSKCSQNDAVVAVSGTSAGAGKVISGLSRFWLVEIKLYNVPTPVIS